MNATQATVDALRAAQAGTTDDRAKELIGAAITTAETEVRGEEDSLRAEATRFWEEIEQHLSDAGKAVYAKVKKYL